MTDLTSTFNTTAPNIDTGNWEEAYDVWLSSNNNEVMIWTDTSSSRLSDNGATIVNPNVTIDGVSYTYQVYEQGTNQSSCGLSVCGSIDMVRNNPEASGTVDIRDVFELSHLGGRRTIQHRHRRDRLRLGDLLHRGHSDF